ncbi:MAG: hypothetical protein H6737_13540 [Alphaproteobacteria bacterium]|nr:hypothetical protein [Alphaproteobacteria bacterium]
MRRLSLLALLFPTPAFAAILTVPTDFATLEEAVAGAAPGDTIRLEAGTYDVEVVIDKALILQAVAGAEVTLTNTSGSSGNILDVLATAASVNIRDLTFDGGGVNRAINSAAPIMLIDNVVATGLDTSGDGAFVNAVDAQLFLTNINVNGGGAASGGLVAVRGQPTGTARLSLVNSTLEAGDASADGGLVFVENAGVTIDGSILTGGTATNGAAVYATNSGNARDLSIEQSAFDGGVASDLGGGVYAMGYGVTLDNVSFTDNTAAAGGGAWLDQGAGTEDLVVENGTEFIGNMASGGGASPDGGAGLGAALVARHDGITLSEITFDQSSATSAAVYLEGDTLALTDATLTNNTATDAAGGIWADMVTSITVDGAIASNNTAGTDAGAMWLQAAALSLTNSSFDLNSADDDGGAVWLGEGEATLSAASFTDNTAARGGAVFRQGAAANLDLSDTDFFRNGASDDGGAVYAEAVTELRLLRNLWCENTAGTPGFGGAIFASGQAGSIAIVRNDGAAGNDAGTGGAYRFSAFDSVDVAFSSYVGNTANTGGVISGQNIVAATIDHVVALASTGSAFHASNTSGPLTMSWSALDANAPQDFASGWNATVPTDPVAITTYPVVNNYPGPAGTTCEDVRLYAAVGSELRDVGPANTDLDGTANDVGLSGGVQADPTLFADGDGDGFDAIDDCDDGDAASNPNALDICNLIDDDCDGQLDENPATTWYEDLDGDGYGSVDGNYPVQCTQPDPSAVDNNTDCDDTNAAINPGAEEICDTLDNDCSGLADDNATDAILFYEDQDFDGWGTDAGSTLACSAPPGYTSTTGDCNDTLANIYPGAPENCDTLDNDCNDLVDDDAGDAPAWYPDADHDGYGVDGLEVVQCLAPLDHSPFGGDCDDADPFRSPGASELCDGIDNDCDGTTDQNPASPLYFPDLDGDGYGDRDATPIGSCSPVSGLLEDASDCDDGDASINPEADETCDGVDQNCDGDIDDDPVDGTVFYLDSDRDGFGNSAFEIVSCFLPGFASEVGGDCNDDNDVQFPGNTEVCDNWDNDCDGTTDEPDAADATTWYADVDDDGYGDDAQSQVACNAPIGFVPANGDCQDTNPTAHPGRAEICDGVDNDCDGTIDGPNAENVQFFFEDADGDGFGNPLSELGACSQPDGYTTNSQDCDDENPGANPTAAEIPGDGIDQDCNGTDLPGGTDTDTGMDGEGCKGCSASGPAPFAMLPLVAAFFLRRRR